MKKFMDFAAMSAIGMAIILGSLLVNAKGERDLLFFTIMGIVGMAWIAFRFIKLRDEVER